MLKHKYYSVLSIYTSTIVFKNLTIVNGLTMYIGLKRTMAILSFFNELKTLQKCIFVLNKKI